MKYILCLLISFFNMTVAICQQQETVSMWQRDGKINVVIGVIAILFIFISIFVLRMHTRLKRVEDFAQQDD